MRHIRTPRSGRFSVCFRLPALIAIVLAGTLTHPAGLDLITGVGGACRLMHMRTLPATSVDSAGTTIPWGHVRPGDVVRANCRMTDAGLVADHIEKLGPLGSREAP